MAEQEETRPGTVLVVGAGVAGIKAALELAETGYRCTIAVNWLEGLSRDAVDDILRQWSEDHGKQQIAGSCPVELAADQIRTLRRSPRWISAAYCGRSFVSRIR